MMIEGSNCTSAEHTIAIRTTSEECFINRLASVREFSLSNLGGYLFALKGSTDFHESRNYSQFEHVDVNRSIGVLEGVVYDINLSLR
jgi:hypothetical protein